MPVKLFDSPGYKVFPDAESINDVYSNLKRQGYDFTATSDLNKQAREEQEGGASIHRPLTYADFDTNFVDAYPIGSVYMNATDPRNPAILLGFGTWERLPAGHNLLNVASSTLDATNLHRKIIKAKVVQVYGQGIVELTLKPLLTDEVRSNLRVMNFNANNFRYDELFVGMKIKVAGITHLTGGTGPLPNGVYTISSTYNTEFGQISDAGSGYDIEEKTHDQNVIRFEFDTEFTGNFGVLGPSDGQEDNAYYTILNDNLYAANTTHSISNSDSFGNSDLFDVDLDIQHFPPHRHNPPQAGGANVRTIREFTGSTGKYHKYDDGGYADDADYDWHIVQYGSLKIPSSTSTAGTRYGGTTISSAGTKRTIQHENRQPFLAVHMWKRIA
jgi:hypothetical protein